MIQKLLCWLGYHDPRVQVLYAGTPLVRKYMIACSHCGKEASGR